MKVFEMEREPNGGVPRYAPVKPLVPLGAAQDRNPVRQLMARVREKEREYVALGPVEGPGGFDMGDVPNEATPQMAGGDDDLNPVKPPTSMADVAEMFVDYSKHLYSKSNLNPGEVMPIAVGLSFYEKYGVQIGMEWIFKLLALKQSEKGATHRVSQIMKIFEHLVGTTKTSEEKKIQL